MSIQGIELNSFRNHENIRVEFSPGLNVIWGENGSGKTSILEAIYTLSLGRSFRTSKRQQMIKKDKDHFRIQGQFSSMEIPSTVSMSQLTDGRRKITVNKESLKSFKELVGKNPVVLLSPEEQVITTGVPSERRRFFDKLFSVSSHEYLLELSEYNKILKQRNAALSQVRENRQPASVIDPWNEPLAEKAEILWNMRKELWSLFSKHLEEVVEKLQDENVVLAGQYLPENPATKDDIVQRFKDQEKRDIILQKTTSGPHKDAYDFTFNGENIRQFGSQGEHKLSLILIKLAEFRFMEDTNENTPIILLDDVLAKLDFKRSEYVMTMLEKNVQTIITTTNIVHVESHGFDINNPNNMHLYLERPCSN